MKMIVVLSNLEECRAASSHKTASDCSVGSRFLATAFRYADHPAVVTRFRSYSYGEISSAALQVSSFLLRCVDFEPGCRVALATDNTPEYLVAYYGILLANGIAVPLPDRIEPIALEAVLEDSGAVLLLTIPQVLSRLRSAPRNARIEQLDLARQVAPVAERPISMTNQLDAGASIFYTSGSTGKPKGVLLSHRNLLANAESILDFLPIRQSDRALASLPFCHAYGNSVLQTHILSGATLILDGSTTFPNTIVDALERHQANSFAGVPELYCALLACSDLRSRPLPHLRYMTAAGAALEPSVAIDLADVISPSQFFAMYGQTEATARLAYLTSDELRKRPKSIGKAIRNVELQILDRRGRAVAVGEAGELCARGPNVMLGYWQDAEATARVLKDGWLHTGDLATVDGDGFIQLAGRCHDQVKIRGLKVVPGEIAQALLSRMPNCQIAVVPFELRNTSRLALFLATDSGEPASPQQIRRVCSETLSRHQMPSHVEILDRLPLTASLKVDLRSLADRAARQVKLQFVSTVESREGTAIATEARV